MMGIKRLPKPFVRQVNASAYALAFINTTKFTAQRDHPEIQSRRFSTPARGLAALSEHAAIDHNCIGVGADTLRSGTLAGPGIGAPIA
jgi:hypothetical protein